MADYNSFFSTEDGALFVPQDIFYKSWQKALVVVGVVKAGPLKIGEQLSFGNKVFPIKQIQVEGVKTEQVNSNEIVGIQLEGKPRDLIRLGLKVRISK